jgi:pimeloyl-ACP methyl ester carboxylesterase
MAHSNFESQGIKLAVHESGEGLPFVFQHGLCGDANQTAQVFPEDAGYRRITVECRGHGQSEPGPFDQFSIETFAGDVAQYISKNGLETPVIGGISMGAAIALRLAVLHSGMFRGLVIARPAWTTKSGPENLRPNAVAGRLLTDLRATDAALDFEGLTIAEMLQREGPDNLNSIRGFFARKPHDVTAQLLRHISADGPGVSEAEIRGIAIPTLVIGTALDYVHPIAYAKTLAEWVPGSQFVEVAAKASDPARYQADFRAALAEFLREI